jgi:hypothetical protein
MDFPIFFSLLSSLSQRGSHFVLPKGKIMQKRGLTATGV